MATRPKGSEDALYLAEAVALLRVARGTDREEAARAYLDFVVADIKRKP